MPESKVRRKVGAAKAGSGASTARSGQLTRKKAPSAPWVGASILVLFAIGIVWLVLYYVTGGGIVGQRTLGGWNILIGFAFIVAGFGMLTQWS